MEEHSNDDIVNDVQSMAKYIPVVEFKGIERFYDIGGLLAQPKAFTFCLELLTSKVRNSMSNIDKIGCFDARGFLLAPHLGVIFQKPIFMLRKSNKMPRVCNSIGYRKEYKGDNKVTGGDELSIQDGAIKPNDRVLLIDDLLATGGTIEAGIKLVEMAGGKVSLCAVIIEIIALKARERILSASSNPQKLEIISLVNDTDIN